MPRQMFSWLFYCMGHLIYLCFDRKWCGGLHWPIYNCYNFFMITSCRIQANGKGPWTNVEQPMISPSNHPEDELFVGLCEEDQSLCMVSIYIAETGVSCTYLTLSEVFQLQKELTITAAKMRVFHAKS